MAARRICFARLAGGVARSSAPMFAKFVVTFYGSTSRNELVLRKRTGEAGNIFLIHALAAAMAWLVVGSASWLFGELPMNRPAKRLESAGRLSGVGVCGAGAAGSTLLNSIAASGGGVIFERVLVLCLSWPAG